MLPADGTAAPEVLSRCLESRPLTPHLARVSEIDWFGAGQVFVDWRATAPPLSRRSRRLRSINGRSSPRSSNKANSTAYFQRFNFEG
jgi:hypothetical protein